jgi:hypothetical protein
MHSAPGPMALDPADPLSLLLHADALVAPSHAPPADGEPDWAALSAALWAAEHEPKPLAAAADSSSAAPFADLDFDFDLGLRAMDAAMAVDPAALHTGLPDPVGAFYPAAPDAMPQTPLDAFVGGATYPFDTLSPASVHQPGRRLSVTSSSSSSGASLSPVMDPASIAGSTTGSSPPATMTADDFAAFIRTLASHPAILGGDLSALPTAGTDEDVS